VLPGIIEALLFVGDRYEARVSLGGEQRILVLLPRASRWHEGQHLRLGLPAAEVSVWPA
jgi:TOBE domain